MTISLPTGMLLHGALESAEQLINPLLKRDASALSRLGAIAGTVIRVHCTQPEVAILIWPSELGLHLELDASVSSDQVDQPLPVDAEVEGSLNDFARFMLAGDRREALLFEGALTLRGDTGLVRKLQKVTSTLDLDLASVSEKLIGAVPTALLSAPLAGFARWRAGLGKTAMQDWQEYLQHELALLPGEAELKGYSDGVLSTRRGVDRLNARIERLQQQVASLSLASSSSLSTPSSSAESSSPSESDQ